MSTPRSLGSITNSILQLNGLQKQPATTSEENQSESQQFIFPILTNQDFKATIANYNQHIKKYNMQVWIENAEVRKFNKEVIRHRRQASIPLEQKIQEQVWKEQHKHLAPEAFNEAVEKYNHKHGPQLRKRNLRQEVKPDTEKYFIAFLHQYNMQLFKRKQVRKKLGVEVMGDLPKMDLYPNKIVEAERNGCRNLPVTVETIRHHRERLEECGVLLGYQFRGANRAIKIAFNAEILVVTDNGSSKNRTTENQSVTQERTNKVQHNNVSSRKNLLDKYKIRDKGDVATAPSDYIATKNTTKKPKGKVPKKFKDAEKISGNAAKKYELSEVLACNLVEKATLGRELSAGKHDKYQPIAEQIARHEAYYGALHPDDFKELAIQDIFKYAASIFSDLDCHPGTWVNAYKLWMNDKFINFNGQRLSKPNTFERWMKCLQVLKEVKKWKKNHPEWQPHYPSLYFDPARSFKENNSFEFAYRFFRLDDEKVESFSRRKIWAEKSLRAKTDVKKAQDKIKDYLIGRISLDQVYEYVNFNCNKQVQDNLNELIKKEFEKIQNV